MFLSYMRTIALYLVLIFSVRLMGKRQIGQMEPSEFVVAMLLADLAAIPMQDGALPLYSGVVPLLTVLGLELLLSWGIMRSVKMRKLFCGKPVILIDNGHILQDNLRKTRITLDELTGHLREKDVLDIGSVQFAILETNGNLSVFPFPKDRPASAREAGVQTREQFLPITIIADGQISDDNLAIAGKDKRWLRKVLAAQETNALDTFLLTVDKGDHVLLIKREEGQ